jgi:hypothetical protein
MQKYAYYGANKKAAYHTKGYSMFCLRYALRKNKSVKTIVLVSHHSKRMPRILLSSVAFPDLPYFSTLSHKRHYFLKKVTKHKTFFLTFSTTFFYETYLILRRIQLGTIIFGAWGSVVVKALRYYSDGPGNDSRCCHLGFFPWLLPTKPCALRSTQPLKMSTRDFS